MRAHTRLFSLSLAAPWLAVLAACQDPSITSPDGAHGQDLGAAGDGFQPWKGQAEPALLYSEQKLDPAERWHEWKRDPDYVQAGGQQYLFISGSPDPSVDGPERWSLGYLAAAQKDPLDTVPQRWVPALSGAAGAWDSGDLSGPAAVVGGPLAPWVMWYAADGDASKPDYVSQIGMATSDDGTHWARRPAPVLGTPAFNGTGADAEPQQAGPASHGLFDPAVLPQGGSTVWFYYAGLSCQGDACRFQILRAISTDGVRFSDAEVVWSGRPGVAAEAGGVAGPSVTVKDGTYYLAYTAVNQVPQRSRASLRQARLTGTLGLAVSTDGVHFRSATGTAPLVVATYDYLQGGASGPSLFVDGKALRMYFGGITGIKQPAFSIGTATLGP